MHEQLGVTCNNKPAVTVQAPDLACSTKLLECKNAERMRHAGTYTQSATQNGTQNGTQTCTHRTVKLVEGKTAISLIRRSETASDAGVRSRACPTK